ncbi:SDR family NAD(P)-dependent oxidoreductase [Burkholderia sp. Ed8]|uniref:SDR family NAD(P)-dependent oxidoreductase n=1 Tax=Burkholderia sp. Ed8 TaxID=3112957 RepID=UPI00345C77AE
MKIDLSSRRAIVTASASGIGLAIAKGLAAAGASVLINSRSQKTCEEAMARLREAVPGASASGLVGDLATAEGVAQFLKQAGEADILVNNLGIYEEKAFGDITDDDWERYFQTNVMSGVRLSRHYLPQMMARGWGRVIFITSESAITPPPTRIHYGMTKAAQIVVARGLAESSAGSGVTVNSIVVGTTLTEQIDTLISNMASASGTTKAEVEQGIIAKYRPSSLIKRLLTAEEVANMVVYRSSSQAAGTNGAALRVEGGGIPTIL